MFAARSSAVLSFLLLASCGGGGGAPPLGVLMSEDAPAIDAGEGFVQVGLSVVDTAEQLTMGDNAAGVSFVAILCFDLTGIGDVTAAELELHRTSIVGNPLTMGPLFLDHIDGGGVLDVADGDGGTLLANALVLNDQLTWNLDVGALVAADVLAGRSTSTFRLRFNVATNGDAVNDYYRVGSSTFPNATLRPALSVTHYAP